MSAIDAVESWIVLLPLYVQIPLLLAVFIPLCWLIAKVVDPMVEWMLRPHAERSGRVRDGDMSRSRDGDISRSRDGDTSRSRDGDTSRLREGDA